MEVRIDDQAYLNEVAGNNLQDIIGDLVTNALGNERAISEVKINGQPYQVATMGPAEELPRDSIQSLEVETIPSTQVALHFLEHGGEYLKAIGASVEQVAELFRVSDEQQASEHYLQTLESLQLFMHVLQSSRETLGLDFDRAGLEGVSAEAGLVRLGELIKELLAAQEQEDWVLLADILQYDLTAELDNWQRLMPVLREQALS